MAFFCRGSQNLADTKQAYHASMRVKGPEDSEDGLSDEELELEEMAARSLGGGMECRRLQILRHFGEVLTKDFLARNFSRCCDVCVNSNFTRRADVDYMKAVEIGHRYPLYYERKGVGGGGRLTLKRLTRLDQFNLSATEEEKPVKFARASELVQGSAVPQPDVEVFASSVTQDSEHNRSQGMQPAAAEAEAPAAPDKKRKKPQGEKKQEKGSKQKKNKLAPGQTLMTAWIQGGRQG
eukprot:754323-Hanusia_phi.AAC.3